MFLAKVPVVSLKSNEDIEKLLEELSLGDSKFYEKTVTTGRVGTLV